ncbi:hypothetical protein D3C81_1111370 [compost metagenome]
MLLHGGSTPPVTVDRTVEIVIVVVGSARAEDDVQVIHDIQAHGGIAATLTRFDAENVLRRPTSYRPLYDIAPREEINGGVVGLVAIHVVVVVLKVIANDELMRSPPQLERAIQRHIHTCLVLPRDRSIGTEPHFARLLVQISTVG